MKKIKKFYQEQLIKVGGSALESYIQKTRLETELVTKLIHENKDDFLLGYIKIHSLDEDQITEILLRDSINELMLAVVRQYKLTPKQQEILIEKGNVLLLEAYLCPKGFFEVERRFATLPEYKFVYSMVKSQKLTGVEIFKTYVDNCYRRLLTEDLVDLLISNENSFATKYIFHRAKLKKEWEAPFVAKASENMLKSYIDEHELSMDDAQIALIQNNYPLAQYYYSKYRFRNKPMERYCEKRELLRQK